MKEYFVISKRYQIGYHAHGNCWKWKLKKSKFYQGYLVTWSFWRLYLVIDNRDKAPRI